MFWVFVLLLGIFSSCQSIQPSKEQFEQKARCAEYTDKAKAQMDVAVGEQFDQIFYSPKLNTCVAVSSIIGSNFPIFEMRDVLSGERIYFEAGSNASIRDDRKKLQDKIAELKKSN